MEAGEYGLTRGTCLLACRLELDAVAGLLSISWRVLGGADFSVFFFSRFFFRFFFPFERTLRAASTRPPCLIYLSTSNFGIGPTKPRGLLHAYIIIRDRSDRGRFLPIGKKASSYRGAYRVPLFN